MERYESYKDSGVAWIGKVPSHWIHFRIKFCLSRSVAGIWGDDEKGNKDDIVCFRVADFDYSKGCLTFDKLTIRNVSAAQLLNRLLHDGDLLIEKSGGGDVTPVGRVVRFNYNDKAICSNFIHSISVKEGYSSNYLYYYFYGMYANKVNLLYFNQTTGIQNLKVGEYLSQKIYLPTLVEQQAIAAYLDKRCSEIDKAIATQQKRIALLQELKQSIITRAVTQGIHPDVPLKESGVEWIGKVPEHWEVMKTSLLYTNIGSGTTPSTSKQEYYEDDGFCWLQTGDLNDGYITDTSKKISKVAVKDYKLRFYPVGSIVIAMYGATIGKIGLLKIPTSTNQACCVLPYSNKMNEMYAFYVCQIAKSQMLLEAVGGGQPNISQDIIKKLKLPVPPLCEQQAIAVYLDGRCSEIDKAIATQQKRIALLQELRQSVIKEAITGKIKVC
ncbi:restriction endonuclease subunit S [Phocaeicola vulgatus]|nr:restriction endonuclease subunit S [Phocaeicola vulgatus]